MKPNLNAWGKLVERALREGNPAGFEYMKERGTLRAYIMQRQDEIAAMYKARIKAGDDATSAANRTIHDYAEKMADEEMTDDEADMIVSEWLASRGEESQAKPLGQFAKGGRLRMVRGEGVAENAAPEGRRAAREAVKAVHSGDRLLPCCHRRSNRLMDAMD